MQQAKREVRRAQENWSSTPGVFRALVDTIASRLDTLDGADRAACSRAVCDTLARYLHDPALFDGMRCVLQSRSYSRLLLHEDGAERFSVLALLWTPGSETPVHAHHAWCAYGLHTGSLTEETYRPEEGPRRPALLGSSDIACGEARCDDSEGSYAHRLANRSRGLAMSLHVYGVSAARIDDGVNRILLK